MGSRKSEISRSRLPLVIFLPHRVVEQTARTGKGELKWIWERGMLVDTDEETGLPIVEGFVCDITSIKDTQRRLELSMKEVELLRDKLEEENISLKKKLETKD